MPFFYAVPFHEQRNRRIAFRDFQKGGPFGEIQKFEKRFKICAYKDAYPTVLSDG